MDEELHGVKRPRLEAVLEGQRYLWVDWEGSNSGDGEWRREDQVFEYCEEQMSSSVDSGSSTSMAAGAEEAEVPKPAANGGSCNPPGRPAPQPSGKAAPPTEYADVAAPNLVPLAAASEVGPPTRPVPDPPIDPDGLVFLPASEEQPASKRARRPSEDPRPSDAEEGAEEGIYENSFDSVSCWRAWIGPKSLHLDSMFKKEYNRGKMWCLPCLICGKDMSAGGVRNHLESKAHYSKLWHKFVKERPVVEEEANDLTKGWVQAFDFIESGRWVFNHLTGRFDLADCEPELGQLVPVTEQQHPPARPPALAADSAGSFDTLEDDQGDSLLNALKSKEAWSEWILPNAKRLQELLLAETGAKENWEPVPFTCLLCRQNVSTMYMVQHHLCSAIHWQSVLRQLGRYKRTLDCATGWKHEWVQAFPLTKGRRYAFNHLTGQQAYVNSDQGTEACSRLIPAKWVDEPHPVRKVFFHSDQDCPAIAEPSDYVHIDRWEETSPSRQYGWYEDWWSRRSGSGWVWNVNVDDFGEYRVFCGHYNNLRRVPGGLWVNNLWREPPPDQQEPRFFHETVVDIKLQSAMKHSRAIFVVPSTATKLVYVHVWKADSPGAPPLPRGQGNHKDEQSTALSEPIPEFSQWARGWPKDWNAPDNLPKDSERSALFWGKSAKQIFNSHPRPAAADINTMLEFLERREGPDGRPVRALLGPPVRQQDNWFSLNWFGNDTSRTIQSGKGNWCRAWHGCKLEALYSILYDGRLRASKDKDRGERFFDGTPGVYVHKDGTVCKSENYVRFVPLCNDGVFWATKWEVRVDRKLKVDKNGTDQWVQKEEGVRLYALWICGRTYDQMRSGDAVARVWEPHLEANPLDRQEEPGVWSAGKDGEAGDEDYDEASEDGEGEEEADEEAAEGDRVSGVHEEEPWVISEGNLRLVSAPEVVENGSPASFAAPWRRCWQCRGHVRRRP